MRLLLLPVAMVLFPMLLGLPWVEKLVRGRGIRMLLCWPTGYFLALALFEALAVPLTMLKESFFHLAAIYSGLLAAAGMFSLVCFFRFRKERQNDKEEKGREKLSFWEMLYLGAFLVLAGWTVIRGITWDATTMNYDDSEYLTRAADALEHGMLLGVSVTQGLSETIFMKRAMQGFLFYPAWLGWISGLPVTVAARTVMESVHLAMAYCVYAAMALALFRKREDALIFLLLLTLLYLMGHYSHYSPTFRLFGPNYQGKATLAVIFFPLVFTLLMLKLNEPYRGSCGVLLMLLSLAAVSMTLFGTVTMVVNVCLPVAVHLIRKPRRWGGLLYVLWASVFPMISAAVYILR